MRKRFPGYYTPTTEEFKQLWDECIFVPDANILLHLFRYGSNTTAQVLDTLERLKPRVWIPYRVGFEFHRKWRDVDQANRDAYDRLSRDVEAQGRKLSSIFDEYTRHQTIDANKEKEEIDKFVKQFLARIEASKLTHPKLEVAHAVLNKLSDLIGEAVGSPPSEEKFAELVKEGKRRFENSIPPGLRDAKKDGADAYGDYFIWSETLDKAKEAQKPIIIITDDVKDDWWLEFRGQKVGPRPELVSEMATYAGQRFYIYTLSQFLDYAKGYLNQNIDPAAIQEIKHDEVQLRKAADTSRGPTETPALQRLKASFLNKRDLLGRQLRSIDRELQNLNVTGADNFEEKVRELLSLRRNSAAQLGHINRNLTQLRKMERRLVSRKSLISDFAALAAQETFFSSDPDDDVVESNIEEEEEDSDEG